MIIYSLLKEKVIQPVNQDLSKEFPYKIHDILTSILIVFGIILTLMHVQQSVDDL